jgi:glycosyltransferase involved in cell wall biosynthesis
MKTNLTVIILTYNEKLHIRRSLENVFQLNPKQVFVVDSPSTDGTDAIAAEMGAIVVAHKYPGNQAAQFNWALDNLPIEGEWILRLDADEYLLPESIEQLKQFIANPQEGVSLVALQVERRWQQRKIAHGIPKMYIPRLFKFGTCRYNQQEMDEKLAAQVGEMIELPIVFVDDNLNSLEWWKQKHLNYAEREARQALSGQHGNKAMYYKLPPYLRAVMYWGIRYFLWKGFLDGRAGWQWNFWQGLWYRWTVDKRIQEMKREKRKSTKQ